MSVRIGLVVPVIQTRFVIGLIKTLLKKCSRADLAVCIVIDGNKEVSRFLMEQSFPSQVHLLNLPDNRCFAGANNAGWHHLIQLYPSLKYIGTINDDTIPGSGWLEALISRLGRNPRTAVAMPIMLVGNRFFRKSYAVWRLGSAEIPMTPYKHKIASDTFVSGINGFCFMARRDALEEVGFFDERYRNSCEDVDLALRLLSSNWSLMVCKEARVYHYEGKSRYRADTRTDLDASHQLLLEKWGSDLSRFNNLDQDGFLNHDPS